ncbi:MAG TPA: YtxH domain-containing protein [Sphingobacteriaceae bacterium]
MHILQQCVEIRGGGRLPCIRFSAGLSIAGIDISRQKTFETHNYLTPLNMNAGKFLGGLILGTAVGLATGLLIAPTSGNQTRRNIVRRSKVYSQHAIDAVKQYLDNIKQGKARMESSITADELLSRYRPGES